MTSRRDITPCLWFDFNAEEAVAHYLAIFPDGRIESISRYGDGPHAGAVMTILFSLRGKRFLALNGGPHFHFSPAISLMVKAGAKAEVDALAERLAEGGKTSRGGRLTDRFGVSWQVLPGEPDGVTPCLWFDFNAEEAVAHYLAIFGDARIEHISRYGAGEHAGAAMTVTFSLRGERFIALNGGPHYKFTPAISLMVDCETQNEIDAYWERLSEGGSKGRCGWLTDVFGLSWQIVPSALDEIMRFGDVDRQRRVMKAVMTMDKLDIAEIQRA